MLWAPRRKGWIVSITDDVLAPAWLAAFEVAGLYRFAPLPLVETGSRVRSGGDGPSSWTCWVCVARPSSPKFLRWGTTRGAYVQAAERDFNKREGSKRIVGAKPLESMCAIVRDYSRVDELVVDPSLGGGTTLIAAKMLGRRGIGMERNLARAKEAAKRIAGTRTQIAMPWGDEPEAKQEAFAFADVGVDAGDEAKPSRRVARKRAKSEAMSEEERGRAPRNRRKPSETACESENGLKQAESRKSGQSGSREMPENMPENDSA